MFIVPSVLIGAKVAGTHALPLKRSHVETLFQFPVAIDRKSPATAARTSVDWEKLKYKKNPDVTIRLNTDAATAICFIENFCVCLTNRPNRFFPKWFFI